MKNISIGLLLIFFNIFAAAKEVKNKINLGNINIKTSANESNKTAMVIMGALQLNSGSGYVSIEAPNQTENPSFYLPGKDGTAGQVLTTNGLGSLTWTTIGQSTGESGQVLVSNGSSTPTWAYIHRTVCPSGYTLLGNSGTPEVVCISSQQEPSNTWLGAISNCYNKSPKAHLCAASEWAMLCISDKNFTNTMTGHWEWVSDSGSNYGRIIGLAGCDSLNGAQVDAKYGSRCCVR